MNEQALEKHNNPTAQAQFLTEAASSPTPTASLTPTFDIKSLQTSIPTLEYNNQFFLGMEASVFLDYLNKFGPEAFLQADRTTRDNYGRQNSKVILYRDLTNDGVPETVVSFGPLYVFGRKDGKYQTLLATESSAHLTFQNIVAFNDLNHNGIPDILVLTDIGTQDDHYYQLFEWGGGKFNSLFGPNDSVVWVLSGGSFRFEDVDQDGMKEIILHNGSPLSADSYGFGIAPWRRITKYYKWDGQYFSVSKKFFDPPVYRFQAAEDADQAAFNRAYDQALDLYQQVIFNDKLQWFTNERKDFILWQMRASDSGEPFHTTPPAPDPNEYLYLSAYARFRIMILHLSRGYNSDAQVVYQTLLKRFPDGTPGSIFAKMAQAFWQSYETDHSLGQACFESRAAIGANGDEATRYLINDYNNEGWHQERYTVDKLCPYP